MNIANKKIIIGTHLYATGPATDLRDYLISQKQSQLLFISHPLFYSPVLSGSSQFLYSLGKVTKKQVLPNFHYPSVFSYFKDIFLDMYWVISTRQVWDLYIGSDNLNAVAGVFLKKIGLVKKTVYYVIDYNPRRFTNNMLNKIYHWLDHLAVLGSDETWNLSPRMETGRQKYFSFTGGHQKVVPIGIWWQRINHQKIKRTTDTLVFMGHVTKKQGLETVINAIPQIIKQVPKFKLLIIGGGDYLSDLKELSSNLKLNSYINFSGFIKDHRLVEKMISGCSAAIAMYDYYVDGEVSFTYFADPAKIKVYLACGLPVIISDVPYNAQTLENLGCGRVTKNTSKAVAEAVIDLFKNPHRLAQAQKKSLEYSKQFDWSQIFKQNILRVLT